jgi:acyl-CoA synthetase (AMP-forming)/AMP-acid ligase II
MPNPCHNIAHYLPEMAEQHPFQRAVVFPESRDRAGRVAYTQLTFAQLDRLCDRYAWGLQGTGVRQGMKTLLMVRPSLDFFALTFAIFKIGAVPVLIDPGMGWKNFMRCVEQAAPEAFLGIPAAHVLRLVRRRFFRSVRIPVTLGRRWFWGGTSVYEMPERDEPFPVQAVKPEDMAAVLFTTGSTGPAKGVVYSHRIFTTQTEILREQYGIGPGDIDLPCFPLFALFSTALGATAVIPDMDPSKPAHVDPERIIEPILNQGVTYSFGSPTLWARVGTYCAERGIRFPTLTRIIMAGAPVPDYVHQRLLGSVLPEGAQTYTPYGATESLPVANFTGREMLAETAERTRAGHGMCVGRPLPNVQCRIIRITDDPIATWSNDLVVPDGTIGEICVKGDVVTRQYHNLPEATALAKIADGDAVRHRMGDVGYLDEDGRIWFCGRKAHRVETGEQTLFTVRCEAIANEHPAIYRSALVGIGEDRYRQTPVLVLEPMPGQFPTDRAAEDKLGQEVAQLLQANPETAGIQRLLFHRSFPVDIRHNAKIRREALAEWATLRSS